VNKKKITVTSNDPENPRLLLEIAADLEQLLDVSPRRQWFGRIKQDETITKTFVIEGKEVDSVTLGEFTLRDDAHKNAYTWKIHDNKTPEGRDLKVDVTVDASKIPPGRFNDVLQVGTDLEKAGNLDLYLSGEVLGPITVNPRRLYFGQYELNREMVKTLTLTANNGEPFQILETSIPEKEFTIDPWNRKSATEHTVTIRMMPKINRDRVRTSMKIRTNMDSQEEVDVDIHAYKRRSRPRRPNPRTNPNRGETKQAKPIPPDKRNVQTRRSFSNDSSREISTGRQ